MSQISSACGGGDAGRALVPGSLRGYRTWRLAGRRVHLPNGALPISSVTRRAVWTPTMTARCMPNDTAAPGPWSAAEDDDHRAPQAGCSCGIYGWYTPTDTGIVSARVFGVIEASGVTLMGERGFRTETAKVIGVVTRNRRLTEACSQAGIAVYRRRRDLVRDHPPEDLSSLLDDVPGTKLRASLPRQASPHGFDGIVFLSVWGRAAVIAYALVALPTASALVTAIVAQCAFIGLLAARLRH